MKIGKIAQASGLSPSGVRYYEEQGLIAPATRMANGYRDYPESAIESLRMIQQAQSFGFSLKEIMEALPAGGIGALRCGDVLALLERKLVEVDRHVELALAARKRIVDAIEAVDQHHPDQGHGQKSHGIS